MPVWELPNDLQLAFEELGPSINSLLAEGAQKEHKTTDPLSTGLPSTELPCLRASVTTLGLSHNALCYKTGAELKEAFSVKFDQLTKTFVDFAKGKPGAYCDKRPVAILWYCMDCLRERKQLNEAASVICALTKTISIITRGAPETRWRTRRLARLALLTTLTTPSVDPVIKELAIFNLTDTPDSAPVSDPLARYRTNRSAGFMMHNLSLAHANIDKTYVSKILESIVSSTGDASLHVCTEWRFKACCRLVLTNIKEIPMTKEIPLTKTNPRAFFESRNQNNTGFDKAINKYVWGEDSSKLITYIKSNEGNNDSNVKTLRDLHEQITKEKSMESCSIL